MSHSVLARISIASFIALSVFLIVCDFIVAGEDDATNVTWLEDFEKALAQAKKMRKLILVDFAGSDWCPHCIKLEKEVFSRPEFGKWVKREGFVLLRLDYRKHTEQSEESKRQTLRIMKKYDVKVRPTVLFLDAAGKARARLEGYGGGGAEKWIRAASEALDAAADKK